MTDAEPLISFLYLSSEKNVIYVTITDRCDSKTHFMGGKLNFQVYQNTLQSSAAMSVFSYSTGTNKHKTIQYNPIFHINTRLKEEKHQGVCPPADA